MPRSVQSVKRTTHHAPRVCVQCGCTDLRACPGGCDWLLKHPATNTGICSNCAHPALDALSKAINASEIPIITGQGICLTDHY